MTKQLAALFVIVLSMVAAVYAMESLQAEIPFAFTVGDQTFSAGTYRLEPAGQIGSGVIRVHSIDNTHSIFLLTNKAERSEKASNSKGYCLVFKKYEKQYFLSKMWAGTIGRDFGQSSAEKEAIAANIIHKPETVVITALIH